MALFHLFPLVDKTTGLFIKTSDDLDSDQTSFFKFTDDTQIGNKNSKRPKLDENLRNQNDLDRSKISWKVQSFV